MRMLSGQVVRSHVRQNVGFARVLPRSGERGYVLAAIILLSGLSLFAQEKKDSPANEADEVALAREQMRLSREQVGLLKLQHAKTGAEIERVEHPVLRFTAPLWGGHHGTVWIWGKRGRPVAVLEMFRQPDGRLWNQAFHATSDVPFKLTATNGESWTPEANSLKIQRLPNAPPPADTPAGRIRQMKAFAQKFTAHEFWTTHPGQPRYELRLISSPVHRYEDHEKQLIDGALFIIAQDTNPEVTLFLEAVQPADEAQPIWQYGIGRTGLAEIVVLYDEQEVFRAPPLRTEVFPKANPYWRMKSVFKDQGSEQ